MFVTNRAAVNLVCNCYLFIMPADLLPLFNASVFAWLETSQLPELGRNCPPFSSLPHMPAVMAGILGRWWEGLPPPVPVGDTCPLVSTGHVLLPKAVTLIIEVFGIPLFQSYVFKLGADAGWLDQNLGSWWIEMGSLSSESSARMIGVFLWVCLRRAMFAVTPVSVFS